MEDVWRLPAVELAGLIKSKKVSAKEAASSALPDWTPSIHRSMRSSTTG